MDSHYYTDHRGQGAPSEVTGLALSLDREPAPPSEQAPLPQLIPSRYQHPSKIGRPKNRNP
jgi:hypothetical protein